MTPSEAHDSAWQREAGHDAMQLGVMKAIHRDLPRARDRDLRDVRVEPMFSPKEGRSFFADVAALYVGEEVSGDRSFPTKTQLEHWVVFEIKPRIYSAGALVRQCRVQEIQGRRWAQARNRSGSTYVTFEVFPVVPVGDPLAQVVADFWQFPIHTWDGERLGWLEPSFLMLGGVPGPTP